MARHIPPHPKKGSPEAYAWAARMQAARKRKGGKRRRKNPGHGYHEIKAREAKMYEREAAERGRKSLADFYHGKDIAHTESEFASRAEIAAMRRRKNPRRKHRHTKHCRCRTKKNPALAIYGLANPPLKWKSCSTQWGQKASFAVGVRGCYVILKSERKYALARKATPQTVRIAKMGEHSSYQAAVRKAEAFDHYKKNPPYCVGKVEGQIYDEVHEVRAQKKRFMKGPYKHVFNPNDVVIKGLDNGNLLMQSKSGKPLWIEDRKL